MSIYTTPYVAKINITAMLENSTTSYQKTLERLSSGVKYTCTADDPIGASQVVNINAEMSSSNVVASNIGIGQDLLSTANGGQEAVVESLQEIKTLCMQALNGTYSSSDKDAILQDLRSQLASIDAVANTTTFNGASLLDGSSSNLTLQIGTSSTATMDVGSALINVHCSQIGGDIRIPSTTTGANWTNIQGYMGKVDAALADLTVMSSTVGGYLNRLDNSLTNIGVANINLTQARSVLADTDVAAESANLVQSQILQQVSASLLSQANQSSSLALNLLKV